MPMQPAKNCVDIGIVVKDIKKSLGFYQDLLGLKKIEELPLWFGTMHRLGFGESFVKLIDPKKVPAGGKVGLDQELGFRYLTFQIANIDEVCQACEKAGVAFEPNLCYLVRLVRVGIAGADAIVGTAGGFPRAHIPRYGRVFCVHCCLAIAFSLLTVVVSIGGFLL